MTAVADRKLNYREYQAIMHDQGLQDSQAVEAYLTRAKHHARMVKKMQASYDLMGMNEAMYNLIKREDQKRSEMVQAAIETAQAEKAQGWKYLEDGPTFVESLLIKYEGDLSQATVEESKQMELADLLDTMDKRQKAGDWR